MVIDTSALLAILFDESDARSFAEAIQADAAPIMSAATRLELDIVIIHRLGAAGLEHIDALMDAAGIDIEPVTAEQSSVAREAYLRYGKGEGHPAQPNFGDCFSYALAKVLQQPLLFKGDDFLNTDIDFAIARRR